MIWIVLGCLLILAIVSFTFLSQDDCVTGCILGCMGAFPASLIVIPLVLWLICATAGLMPNYGEGVRYGYVTKMSHRGLLWKTHEGQMQIGTGEMAALQEPFCFCAPDENVRLELASLIGTRKKVGLRYQQWLLIPFRLGSSEYEIIGVEFDGKVNREL